MSDPRREHSLQLLAVINAWPAPESLAPTVNWSIEAVRVRTERKWAEERRRGGGTPPHTIGR
ncbi:hypothetical protein ABZ686_02050 [Streptomyces sp. NPDC006992]|uniref:hypothetical protein n=1 Tax=unclassified Streptomyces TaxID=2593676 RepID=UPI0033CCFB68